MNESKMRGQSVCLGMFWLWCCIETACVAVLTRHLIEPLCVALCCSVLQCVTVCCSVVQRVPVCSSVFQCVPVCSIPRKEWKLMRLAFDT